MRRQGEKKKKCFKILDRASTIFLALVICLCAAIAIQVQVKGYASVFGFSAFRVVTGSMEPTLTVGSLVIARQTDIEEIEVGDIVCFISSDAAIQGYVNTHRVIAVGTDASGQRVLTTQGDANTVADAAYVTEQALIGRVVWHSSEGNILMSGLSVLTSKMGFLICIAVPAMILLVLVMRLLMLRFRREIDALMREIDEKEREQKRLESAGLTPEEYQAM
ncbi:MAG: signal peptidase I [Oscillospiraceae bacterium]|nr:signal peptidase I [Oscillospiraceae bacterium]